MLRCAIDTACFGTLQVLRNTIATESAVSKADDIRCFTEDIAQWRVDGLTWARIAAKLVDQDIQVGTDEIRSYWPRLSEGRSPAEYLLYWRSSQHNAELRDARRQLEAAEAEIEELRRQLSELRQTLAQAEEIRKQHGHMRYAQGVATGQGPLEVANRDLDDWAAFATALARAHQARNHPEVTRLLDHVVAWAKSQGQG